jgi:hypothetical protein
MAKYYLTECLIIKDENQYLIEHLTQNALSGIEHFYIYDNYSKESVSDFLQNNAPEWLSKCTIIVKKSEDNFQEDSYHCFIEDYSQQCVWTAFVDVDEMFEGNLQSFCRFNEELYNSLSFKQIIHGANNQVFESNETLRHRFMSDIVTDIFMVKSVVKNKDLLRQEAHRSYMKGGDLRQLTVERNAQVKLHHFYFRSFEEYIKKILRGSANPKGRPYLMSFFRHNSSISVEDCKTIFDKYNVDMKLRAKYYYS